MRNEIKDPNGHIAADLGKHDREQQIVIGKITVQQHEQVIEIEMPDHASILHVAEQSGQMCVWFAYDVHDFDICGYIKRKFVSMPTGYPGFYRTTLDDYFVYRGTVQFSQDKSVRHLFELVPKNKPAFDALGG